MFQDQVAGAENRPIRLAGGQVIGRFRPRFLPWSAPFPRTLHDPKSQIDKPAIWGRKCTSRAPHRTPATALRPSEHQLHFLTGGRDRFAVSHTQARVFPMRFAGPVRPVTGVRMQPSMFNVRVPLDGSERRVPDEHVHRRAADRQPRRSRSARSARARRRRGARARRGRTRDDRAARRARLHRRDARRRAARAAEVLPRGPREHRHAARSPC